MNSFGPSSSQQYPLYNPKLVRENRKRFRRADIPHLDEANSLCVPSGRYPARGWLLMRRGDYDLMSKTPTYFELNIGDTTKTDNVSTLGYLSIVQAQCVTRGVASDPNALYLVEITDRRGVLCNDWFQYPLNAKYNIRSPAYPSTFYPDSMNGGTTWTWATMLEDIWDNMFSLLGPWPGIPTAPSGVPEGFWFVGVSAWKALCDVLDHIGLAVACDLTSATPYTIVESGSADASFTALETRYANIIEEDLEWIDAGSGRAPGAVVVLFRRRNSVYGTEETVYYGNDDIAKQWVTNTVYSVSVSAPAIFSGSAGVHHMWSDFTVRYDDDSNPLAEDVATATAIAQERVAQYFDRIYRRTSGFMSRIYTGALPFTTGSLVDWVRWSMDYSRGPAGWTTEIARGCRPPL